MSWSQVWSQVTDWLETNVIIIAAVIWWFYTDVYSLAPDAISQYKLRYYLVILCSTSPRCTHQYLHLLVLDISLLQQVYWSGITALQNDEIWTKKLRYLWSDTVEHTSADHEWPITDTDSVLCTVLFSSTTVAPLWQFRLIIAVQTQMYLHAYCLCQCLSIVLIVVTVAHSGTQMDNMAGSAEEVSGHVTSQCLVAIGRLQVTSSPNSNDLLGGNGNSNEFISRHSIDGKFTFVDQRCISCCLSIILTYIFIYSH